jgi:G3E family GTPase
MTNRLPVTIVGGYLGAGKTTLLNGLLSAAHGVKLAVIVNDFGSINIDASLIASRGGETIGLANGCVCCTIGDSLALTLHDLAERGNGPEHIIIEASGVADISKIARFGASHPRLTLDCVIVVADAGTIRARADDKYVGDLVRRQLGAADVIVISKIDLLEPRERQRLLAQQIRDWIESETPGARILEADGGALFAQLILAGGTAHIWKAPPPRLDDPAPRCHADDEHAKQFTTWSFSDDRPLDGAALRAAIGALPRAVIRAKGIVRLAEDPSQWFVLQLVGRRWSLQPAPPLDQQPRSSDIIFIGLSGQMDPRDLAALFAGVRTGGSTKQTGSGLTAMRESKP